MSSDPDWWARAIGAAALALSGLQFGTGQYASRWRRRHAAMDPLRTALNDLAPGVLNAADLQQARNLFSVAAGSHLSELEEAIDRVPDRQFQKWLRAFVEALNAVRGAQQPDNQDGTPAALTAAQIKKLEVAKTNLERIVKRMNKATKKGAA